VLAVGLVARRGVGARSWAVGSRRRSEAGSRQSDRRAGRAVAGQCRAEVGDGRRADRCGDYAQMDRGEERGDLRKRMGRL
jgi:hypothetical protein